MKRLTRKERDQYLKDHGNCAECGSRAEEVHHIKMLRNGGTNEPGNLKALCKRCHADSEHAICAGRLVIGLDEDGKAEIIDEFIDEGRGGM